MYNFKAGVLGPLIIQGSAHDETGCSNTFDSTDTALRGYMINNY